MPGAVIKHHADIEHECGKCHVRSNRAAQPALCLDCHKPVAADVKSGQGYHGRLKDTTCRSCHTEHKGRNAKIVKLDTQHFDHDQTDFKLKGKHQAKLCSSCHRNGEPWRRAPAECVDCHRIDDKHKSGLGEKCGSCHTESTWKDARFDHDKTRFPLKLSHADAQCSDCHRDQRYTNTPRDCVGCHRKDDVHKGTYGSTCEKCHNESNWKRPTFRHDRDTHFPLLDKHRTVKCESCHRTPPFREKTPTRCVACHRSDDAHRSSLGDKCDKCHSAAGWKDARFNHDLDTHFPLKEKHAQAKCQSCHKDENLDKRRADKVRSPTPTQCVACHTKDDQDKGHQGKFGDKCESCHNERGFQYNRFDHDSATQFKLRSKHQSAKCTACHITPLYITKTETRCIACHEKEDQDKGHKGNLGAKCESCHDERGFKYGRFDHDSETQFKLQNKHQSVTCNACHRIPVSNSKTDTRCISCHEKEDQGKGHKGNFGTKCESCHDDRGFKYAKFDHDGETQFSLRDKHLTAKCNACHRTPLYSTTTDKRCVGCHAKDDVHFSSVGTDCERCHVAADDWRKIIKQDSNDKGKR